MEIDVVINTDNKYIQHTMAMLCSLYENNKEHQITLHVLQNSLSEDSRKYITDLTEKYNNKSVFYTVDDNRLIGVQFRKNRPLSLAAYYRLLLADILPKDLNQVLYLDCDMIVMGDISELFKLELDDYALAATLDKFPYSNQHRLQLHMEADERTFCSGMMLVNLKYWRENKVTEELIEYAKRKRDVVYLHDQDVLNYFFKKKWFLLPPKWNRIPTSTRAYRYYGYRYFDYEEYTLRPKIIHYASVDIKPWYSAPMPHKRKYVKFLEKSGFDNIKFDKISFHRRFRLVTITIKVMLSECIRKRIKKF